MTCPLAEKCIAPACKPGGRLWQAKGTSAANLKAFQDDVRAYIELTGDTRKPGVKVFRLAMKDVEKTCVLG